MPALENDALFYLSFSGDLQSCFAEKLLNGGAACPSVNSSAAITHEVLKLLIRTSGATLGWRAARDVSI